MKHLSPAEFVDYADGALDPARAAHLDACASCRASAAALHATMERASLAADVPEPSPLFWDHLSARIREQIAGKRPARPWNLRWIAQPGFVPVAAAAIVVALVSASVTLWRVPPPVPSLASPVPSGVAHSRETAADPSVDDNANEMWDVLAAVASDLEWEDVHAEGMTVPPAAVDRAVLRLTPVELSELQRLLHSEMKGSGD